MSQVIGLAYVKPTALRLVVHNKGYDVRVFPGDTDWKQHLASAEGRKKTIAVVEDRRQFKKALKAELPLVVACINDVDWLERRGIPCLDGRKDGDHLIQLAVTPDQIYTELAKSEVYTASPTDIWLTKSNPKDRCAGCKHLHVECGYEPKPTSKRPCGDEFERDTSKKAYKSYNLSQLIHLALNAADEDKLLEAPQKFWRATYTYARGQMTQSDWVNNHGRLLKSAGTPKPTLQAIIQWVKAYNSYLVKGKVRNPPSKLDIRLANKLLKSR